MGIGISPYADVNASAKYTDLHLETIVIELSHYRCDDILNCLFHYITTHCSPHARWLLHCCRHYLYCYGCIVIVCCMVNIIDLVITCYYTNHCYLPLSTMMPRYS